MLWLLTSGENNNSKEKDKKKTEWGGLLFSPDFVCDFEYSTSIACTIGIIHEEGQKIDVCFETFQVTCNDGVGKYHPLRLDVEDPILEPADVPGPEITLQNVELKTLKELQAWLKFRGCHQVGNKAELTKR